MTEEIDVEEVDSETLARIRERTLREKKQLHMQKVHNLIPKLKEIVEEEIPSNHASPSTPSHELPAV